ncbi:uncharacterized protein ACMZJ9_022307, partial [Mantella aurantiaca]
MEVPATRSTKVPTGMKALQRKALKDIKNEPTLSSGPADSWKGQMGSGPADSRKGPISDCEGESLLQKQRARKGSVHFEEEIHSAGSQHSTNHTQLSAIRLPSPPIGHSTWKVSFFSDPTAEQKNEGPESSRVALAGTNKYFSSPVSDKGRSKKKLSPVMEVDSESNPAAECSEDKAPPVARRDQSPPGANAALGDGVLQSPLYRSSFAMECQEIVKQIKGSEGGSRRSPGKRKAEELDVSAIDAEPPPYDSMPFKSLLAWEVSRMKSSLENSPEISPEGSPACDGTSLFGESLLDLERTDMQLQDFSLSNFGNKNSKGQSVDDSVGKWMENGVDGEWCIKRQKLAPEFDCKSINLSTADCSPACGSRQDVASPRGRILQIMEQLGVCRQTEEVKREGANASHVLEGITSHCPTQVTEEERSKLCASITQDADVPANTTQDLPPQHFSVLNTTEVMEFSPQNISNITQEIAPVSKEDGRANTTTEIKAVPPTATNVTQHSISFLHEVTAAASTTWVVEEELSHTMVTASLNVGESIANTTQVLPGDTTHDIQPKHVGCITDTTQDIEPNPEGYITDTTQDIEPQHGCCITEAMQDMDPKHTGCITDTTQDIEPKHGGCITDTTQDIEPKHGGCITDTTQDIESKHGGCITDTTQDIEPKHGCCITDTTHDIEPKHGCCITDTTQDIEPKHGGCITDTTQDIEPKHGGCITDTTQDIEPKHGGCITDTTHDIEPKHGCCITDTTQDIEPKHGGCITDTTHDIEPKHGCCITDTTQDIEPKYEGCITDTTHDIEPKHGCCITDTTQDIEPKHGGCITDTTHDIEPKHGGCITDTTQDIEPKHGGCITDTTQDIEPKREGCITDTTQDIEPKREGCITDTFQVIDMVPVYSPSTTGKILPVHESSKSANTTQVIILVPDSSESRPQDIVMVQDGGKDKEIGNTTENIAPMDTEETTNPANKMLEVGDGGTQDIGFVREGAVDQKAFYSDTAQKDISATGGVLSNTGHGVGSALQSPEHVKATKSPKDVPTFLPTHDVINEDRKLQGSPKDSGKVYGRSPSLEKEETTLHKADINVAEVEDQPPAFDGTRPNTSEAPPSTPDSQDLSRSKEGNDISGCAVMGSSPKVSGNISGHSLSPKMVLNKADDIHVQMLASDVTHASAGHILPVDMSTQSKPEREDQSRNKEGNDHIGCAILGSSSKDSGNISCHSLSPAKEEMILNKDDPINAKDQPVSEVTHGSAAHISPVCLSTQSKPDSQDHSRNKDGNDLIGCAVGSSPDEEPPAKKLKGRLLASESYSMIQEEENVHDVSVFSAGSLSFVTSTPVPGFSNFQFQKPCKDSEPQDPNVSLCSVTEPPQKKDLAKDGVTAPSKLKPSMDGNEGQRAKSKGIPRPPTSIHGASQVSGIPSARRSLALFNNPTGQNLAKNLTLSKISPKSVPGRGSIRPPLGRQSLPRASQVKQTMEGKVGVTAPSKIGGSSFKSPKVVTTKLRTSALPFKPPGAPSLGAPPSQICQPIG